MTTPTPNPVVYLPTDPPRPAPPILTPAEVSLLLRLSDCVSNPDRTLKHYRDSGQLKAVRLGRGLVYRLPTVLEFMERRENGEVNE